MELTVFVMYNAANTLRHSAPCVLIALTAGCSLLLPVWLLIIAAHAVSHFRQFQPICVKCTEDFSEQQFLNLTTRHVVDSIVNHFTSCVNAHEPQGLTEISSSVLSCSIHGHFHLLTPE